MLCSEKLSNCYAYLSTEYTLNNANSILDLGSNSSLPMLRRRCTIINPDKTIPDIDESLSREIKHEKFIIAPRENPNQLVVTYGECSTKMELRPFQYHRSTVKEILTQEHIDETIREANLILDPLRGQVAKLDRFILFYLLIGIITVGTLSVIIGMFLHYALSVVLAFVYITILIVVLWKTKRRAFEL